MAEWWKKKKEVKKKKHDEGKVKEVNRDIICEELDLYLLIHQEISGTVVAGEGF